MNRLFRGFRNAQKQPKITVVSGLPRSGTSMMMKMLEAGGLPLLTDHQRRPDDDNPKGYYEFERVKKLPEGDTAWLPEARGKVVKIISALLEYLPGDYEYQVIFMHRRMEEILASQRQMLIRSEKPADEVSDERLAEMYRKHLARVEAWLAERPNFALLHVDYNEMLADAREYAGRVNDFLGNRLDVERMVAVVDPALYRQRR